MKSWIDSMRWGQRNRSRSASLTRTLFDRPCRWESVRLDPVILGVTVALALTGLVMVFSASGVLAENRYREPTHYLQRQALWLGVGFLVLVYMARQDYRVFKRWTPLLVIASAGLLIVVVCVGREINGAHRWLTIGGLSVQPSELAKVSMIVYLAAYLSKVYAPRAGWRDIVLRPACIVGLLAALVVVEPDYGNAALMGFIFVGMLFLAGAQIRYLMIMGWSMFLSLGVLVWLSPERWERVMTFIDPFADANGAGYQLTQSLYSFGHGGWTGVGLGHGKQKLFYLPEGHTDFVFALIGEELGLLGTASLLGLYGVLVTKGFQVAAQASDAFGRSLAQGITLLIGGQALINVGVASGLLPTKGLPLPLVSYGGSSAVMSLLALGILLSIAKECPSRLSSQVKGTQR